MLVSLLYSLALLGARQVPTIQLPVILPMGTTVKLQLLRPLSSATSQVGDNVVYSVAEDVLDTATPPHVLIPAGAAIAVGKVTAKRSRMDLSHSVGMLAFSAESIALSDGDMIPIHIQQTDNAHHDFRTKTSLVPPKPTAAEVTAFKEAQLPFVDTLLGAIGTKTESSALVASPLSQNSLLMLAKVIKFKESDQVVGQIQNIEALRANRFAQLVGQFKSAKSLAGFGRTLGIATGISLLGAGIGLIELVEYIKGMFRQVTVANGTIFTAHVTEDTRIQVAAAASSRSIWNINVKVLKSRLFKGPQLFVPTQGPNGRLILTPAKFSNGHPR